MMRSLPLMRLSWLAVGFKIIPLCRALSTRTVRPDTSNYRSLLLNDIPLMDVRAPVEFGKGSFPSAQNHPLLTDDERHEIGLCYKLKGQSAAIQLGQKLVSGEAKEERVGKWTEFCRANPHGHLYCFRGGLRSQAVQKWIEDETGIRYPLVTGGYKAMRRFLMEEMDRSLDIAELILVGGATGSGKTRVIEKLGAAIDLEGMAHHRGSAFGRMPEDPLQPAQIDFENSISISLLKLLAATETTTTANTKPHVFVEHEGSRIGNLGLPLVLREKMAAAPIVVVEEEMEERVNVILEDYAIDLGRRFIALYGDEVGPELHREFAVNAIKRLKKRLGGDRYEEMNRLLQAAFKEQASTGDLSLHRVWITTLLEDYYDPMYAYQLEQHAGQVLFRGNRAEVIDWANSKPSR